MVRHHPNDPPSHPTQNLIKRPTTATKRIAQAAAAARNAGRLNMARRHPVPWRVGITSAEYELAASCVRYGSVGGGGLSWTERPAGMSIRAGSLAARALRSPAETKWSAASPPGAV